MEKLTGIRQAKRVRKMVRAKRNLGNNRTMLAQLNEFIKKKQADFYEWQAKHFQALMEQTIRQRLAMQQARKALI
jgi:hypothetical protein